MLAADHAGCMSCVSAVFRLVHYHQLSLQGCQGWPIMHCRLKGQGSRVPGPPGRGANWSSSVTFAAPGKFSSTPNVLPLGSHALTMARHRTFFTARVARFGVYIVQTPSILLSPKHRACIVSVTAPPSPR